MRKALTIFLQLVTVLVGIGSVVFLLWEPHLEGRNVNATNFEIYFKDPFLAYAYIASITFFTGLYHMWKMLGHIRRHGMFSQEIVRRLRIMQSCALIAVGFIWVGEVLFIISNESDDRAGGIAMGIYTTLIAGIVALVTGKLKRIIEKELSY